MTSVTQFSPSCKVRLLKVIRRPNIVPGIPVAARYGNILEYDLTPYLGEKGGIRTSKSVKEPAGGFTLTLADKPSTDWADSIYALIEPMDVVEIRFARNPSDYTKPDGQGGSLPVVMRGFVSTVKRSKGMAQGPERHITVIGQDYGKIWQILQVLYLNNAAQGTEFLTGFNFFQKYGVDTSANMDGTAFVIAVVNRVIEPYVNNLIWSSKTPGKAWPTFELQTDVYGAGTVFGSVVNSWPGGQGIYGLIAHACDVSSGWNELFIEDRQSGPTVVFRPIPWRDVKGAYIQEGTPFISSTDIDASHIKSIEVERTDQGVANLCWVRSPVDNVVTDDAARLSAQMTPITNNPNCDPRVYGIRQMDVTSYMGPPDWKGGLGVSAKLAPEVAISADQWRQKRRASLAAAFEDSVVFEHGTMRLRGNEKIGAGTFLNITRGSLTSRCYVTSVSHEFLPFRGFWTTVQFERGTGFIDRAGSQSPYIAEMASVRPY